VGDLEPHHWGTGTGLPDQDGLWGISAYVRSDQWLFVTHGLSELFGKVGSDPNISGWGEELTIRVLRSGDDVPPAWPVRLLARLGELVFQRAEPFLPGGRLQIPDAPEGFPPAVCWAEDPELGPVTGPLGRFEFVATVGISGATLAEMQASSTRSVLDAKRRANPELVAGGPGLTW
jgi:suppressor of fused-like protein